MRLRHIGIRIAALAALVLVLAAPTAAAAPPPTLVAAGDIACAPDTNTPSAAGCQQAATAGLVRGLAPTVVAALGDVQYESAKLSEFSVFDATWGAFKPLIRPAPGNHEYYTSGAAGYFDYFNGIGAATGPAGNRGQGYYSYNVGAWHIVALNSNCDIVACAAGSPQEQWLRADLAQFRTSCTLGYWHHALFTSGPNRNDPNDLATFPLWQALQDAGADVVLGGHDHHYERFGPQDALGNRDNEDGMREFVVGTGGKSLYNFERRSPVSEFRDNSNFGVLHMTLEPSGYDWRFITTNGGATLDSGSGTCHNTPPELVALAIAHRAFAVARVPTALSGRARAAARPPYGSAITFVMNRPASVRLQFSRLLPGRRSGRRCVAPRRRLNRSPKCTRTIAQGSLEREAQEGRNRVFFTGRIGNRPLAPGNYRLTVTATANTRSTRPRALNFRIIRR